jgi:hypothetical protein
MCEIFYFAKLKVAVWEAWRREGKIYQNEDEIYSKESTKLHKRITQGYRNTSSQTNLVKMKRRQVGVSEVRIGEKYSRACL